MTLVMSWYIPEVCLSLAEELCNQTQTLHIQIIKNFESKME